MLDLFLVCHRLWFFGYGQGTYFLVGLETLYRKLWTWVSYGLVMSYIYTFWIIVILGLVYGFCIGLVGHWVDRLGWVDLSYRLVPDSP